ncbi:MDS1 and EVI1 complex locus protein EVI1-A [Monomorium pharaonis]|uniref:MDS1 and EVI1 complex locus protein EVI1-A n=1 Tax=Monomorium pharaonis TaxID=307658 RepID=UPI0017477D20|nr:MDS1 and EVI1 complex locus protein EVI1-A [Monomorium pharaonis]
MPASASVPVAPVAPVAQSLYIPSLKGDEAQASIIRQGKMCPNCGKGLACQSSLKRHLETVCGKVRNVNGKWICVCGRRYETIGSLTRHKRFECRVEPQFHCIFCGRKFTQQCSLSRHLKNKHSEGNISESVQLKSNSSSKQINNKVSD